MNTGDLSTKHVADTIYICIKIRNEKVIIDFPDAADRPVDGSM